MTANPQSSIDKRQSTPPKRKRLTPKQRQFLQLVYGANMPILEALTELRIRVVTFERWLHKPVFVDRLRMYITQYYVQVRLDMARAAHEAVSVLTRLTANRRIDAEARKACTDILNFHTQYAKIATRQAQNGAPVDNLGALMAQFGAVLDNKDTPLPTQNTPITTKNRILAPENGNAGVSPA
jgi:hypothetical protein